MVETGRRQGGHEGTEEKEEDWNSPEDPGQCRALR
jgi:hypothetical protein